MNEIESNAMKTNEALSPIDWNSHLPMWRWSLKMAAVEDIPACQQSLEIEFNCLQGEMRYPHPKLCFYILRSTETKKLYSFTFIGKLVNPRRYYLYSSGVHLYD